MIKLLVKIFIKNSEEVSDPTVRAKYGLLSGTLGIILNLLLFAGKLLAGILSGAISIVADAFNNLSDAGSSIMTAVGFKLSNEEADDDHPFGHGRIEYIVGLIVSMIVIVVGIELLKSSIERIITPAEIEFSWLSVGIMAGAIVVKLWMFLYNSSLSKKINSAALKATGLDSISDCISTFVVLAGMLIFHYFDFAIDAYFGILVSAIILWSGIKAAKDTINPLIGEAVSLEWAKEVEKLVLSHEQIHGIHDFVAHDYGVGRKMVSLHAEVPSNANILEIHDVIDDIERDIRREFGVEAVIHMDPIDVDDVNTEKMRKLAADIAKGLDERITVHDFRMTAAHSHCNLIFDVVVPHKFRMTDEEVKEYFAIKFAEKGNYYTVITIDKPAVEVK